jgi:PAS domain S-box-containing protein
MKVKDAMVSPPFCLMETDAVRYAAIKFSEKGIDGAPVINEAGKPVGLFTKINLFEFIKQGLAGTIPVKKLMTTPVPTVNMDTSVEDILRKNLHLAAVTDREGKLVGTVTRESIRSVLLIEYERSHDKLKTILESSYNAIIAVDAKGYITNWNPAAARLTGIGHQQARGHFLTDILPKNEMLNVLKTGKSKHGQKVQFAETVAISNRAPIIRRGEIVGAVSVLQDISDLENIAAELKLTRELNKELDAIIDSVYEGLYITDGQANTLRINKAYTRLTGIKADEVIGKNMRELVASGYYSQSVTLLVLEKRKPITILHDIKGRKRCLITGNPIFNEKNEIFRVVTTVRDVTELNRLKQKLERTEKISEKYHLEIEHLRSEQMKATEIIGPGEKMKEVLSLAYQASRGDATILILGETGVGKELVARYIHKNSLRNKAPFIKVNTAAIPENLLESELFGYEKGAFTDAKTTGKPGMFELADTGTIFLDEIGDLPLRLQAKLLRVLQDKEVTRVGGTKIQRLDLRIIAATNRDLGELVKKGTFREDVYYRINVIPLHIPPLRIRPEEVPFLARHFLASFNKKYDRSKALADHTMEALMQYPWPGNVRELKNLIERWVVIGNDDIITQDLFAGLRDGHLPHPSAKRSDEEVRLKEALSQLERQLISKALVTRGSTRKAARSLGVSQPTIIRKARKYGIEIRG